MSRKWVPNCLPSNEAHFWLPDRISPVKSVALMHLENNHLFYFPVQLHENLESN